MKHVLALVCILAAASFDAAAGCKPSLLKRDVSKTVINLNGTERGARAAPAFYLQNPTLHLVLFFKPEDVSEVLRKQEARYAEENLASALAQHREYMQTLLGSLPLKSNKNLFEFVLAGASELREEVMVSDLLKEGKASIGDWSFLDDKLNEELRDMKTITMYSKGGSEESARWFCTPLNQKLFGFTYIIYD